MEAVGLAMGIYSAVFTTVKMINCMRDRMESVGQVDSELNESLRKLGTLQSLMQIIKNDSICNTSEICVILQRSQNKINQLNKKLENNRVTLRPPTYLGKFWKAFFVQEFKRLCNEIEEIVKHLENMGVGLNGIIKVRDGMVNEHRKTRTEITAHIDKTRKTILDDLHKKLLDSAVIRKLFEDTARENNIEQARASSQNSDDIHIPANIPVPSPENYA